MACKPEGTTESKGMKHIAPIMQFICAVSICGMTGSCKKVPDELIQPDSMAELLADLNMGEAVVDANRRNYPDSADRATLKQAIYGRHGVSGEQVDSSLAWYGRNIKLYVEVCDKSIEILEHRMIESGNRLAAANALTMGGDSVDIWPFPRYIHISPKDASRCVTFSFISDDNWNSGDIYTWRAKFINTSGSTSWGIVTEYADGLTETVHGSFAVDGWQEISFFTDTIQPAARIYGYLNFSDKSSSDIFIDSVSIVRKRFNESLFSQHYRQRKLKNINGRLHPVHGKDDVANDSLR